MKRNEEQKDNKNSKGRSPQGRSNNRSYHGNKGRSNKDKFDKGANLDSKGRDNDPNWYFTSPELATQASELSFQNMLGAGPVISNYEVPGIMVFRMNPCPGVSFSVANGATYNPTDAELTDYAYKRNTGSTVIDGAAGGINLMSTKIYTLLSTYSGRTSSYGPEDVAAMLLAIGEIGSVVEHLRRAFGVAMTYNPRNRFLPVGLLKAMNIDGDDLFANLANYRMRFNTLIARINQIPILDNIGYIRKCRDMYQKIYMDEVSSMGQIYFYVPDTTWTMMEAYVTGNDPWAGETCLLTTPIITNADRTMGDLLGILENMVNKLLFSSTLNVVYSDLFNLANKIGVQFSNFDYLAENYVVMPEYNRNANLQMHNLTVFGKPNLDHNTNGITTAPLKPYSVTDVPVINAPNTVNWGNGSLVITPNNDVWTCAINNTVVYSPAVVVPHGNVTNKTESFYSGLQVVDMDTDMPTMEDRIEALRFKAFESGFVCHSSYGTSFDKSNVFKILPSLPDHYCTGIHIFTSPTSVPTAINKSVSNGNNIEHADLLSQCALHPIMYYKNSAWASTVTDISGLFGSLTFFTCIDYNYLNRLNRLITTGLFDFR